MSVDSCFSLLKISTCPCFPRCLFHPAQLRSCLELVGPYSLVGSPLSARAHRLLRSSAQCCGGQRCPRAGRQTCSLVTKEYKAKPWIQKGNPDATSEPGTWRSSQCFSARSHCPGASCSPPPAAAEQQGEELPDIPAPWVPLPTPPASSARAAASPEA